MAKAKSKKITIEEALVPVEEQEYNIPNNWIWIYQNFVCQLANGEKMSGEEYPYLEVKYLRGDTDAEIKDSGRFITANTKVILVDGENSGEVFEVLEDGYMNKLLDEAEAPKAHEAEQLDMFTDYAAREAREQADEAAHARERKLQEAMLGIKKRYGKNAILKGMSLEEGATAKERNQTIGGHQA